MNSACLSFRWIHRLLLNPPLSSAAKSFLVAGRRQAVLWGKWVLSNLSPKQCYKSTYFNCHILSFQLYKSNRKRTTYKRHFSQQQTASSNCILKVLVASQLQIVRCLRIQLPWGGNCRSSLEPVWEPNKFPPENRLAGWMFFLLLRCLAVPPAISTKVPNSLPGLGSLCRGVFFLGDKDLGECFGHRKFFERKAEESSFSNFLGKFCQYCFNNLSKPRRHSWQAGMGKTKNQRGTNHQPSYCGWKNSCTTRDFFKTLKIMG